MMIFLAILLIVSGFVLTGGLATLALDALDTDEPKAALALLVAAIVIFSAALAYFVQTVATEPHRVTVTVPGEAR